MVDRPRRRCIARNRNGQQCGRWARPGATCCATHLRNPAAIRNAEVRAEVMRWGLGDATVDPGEVLLRLVTQSSARVERYSRLLEEAYDAAERLRAAHEAQELLLDPMPVGELDDDNRETAAIQQARQDLERIFHVGGVSALIGYQYSATITGSVYASTEAIRGLAKLEAEERDRCADFAAKAVKAGLAERQVRIAERQGAQIMEIMLAVLGDPAFELSDDKIDLVPAIVERHLALVAG